MRLFPILLIIGVGLVFVNKFLAAGYFVLFTVMLYFKLRQGGE